MTEDSQHSSDSASTESLFRRQRGTVADFADNAMPPRTEPERFQEPDRELSMKEVCLDFIRYVKTLGVRQIIWVTILSLFVIAGQGMQLIFLNYWLREYPANQPPGNYTTFFISSLLFSIFFIVWLIGYMIFRKPKKLGFMLDLRGLWLLIGIGTMDTVNSVLQIYSADHASEVLEAVFTSLTPPLTAGLARLFINERRSVLNVWFLLAMLLVVGGVLLASGYDMAHDTNGVAGQSVWWTVIFLLSIPPNVFLNCWQARYMILFTQEDSFEEEVLRLHIEKEHSLRVLEEEAIDKMKKEDTAAEEKRERKEDHNTDMEHRPVATSEPYGETGTNRSHSLNEGSDAHEGIGMNHRVVYPDMKQSNDTLVKLWMLVGDTTVQFLQTVILLPADAIPWWGGSSSVADAGQNLGNGLVSFFTYRKNFLYGALYSAGFIFTYIGSAYLNHYSVTLCSMVTEIASPLTALLLLIAPAINLSGSETPLGYSLPAVFVLMIGTILYTLWDYSTESQKKKNEFDLKYRCVRTRVVACTEEDLVRSDCSSGSEPLEVTRLTPEVE